MATATLGTTSPLGGTPNHSATLPSTPAMSNPSLGPHSPSVGVTSPGQGSVTAGCDANNNHTGGSSGTASSTTSSGGRRKISLPSWFRQNSAMGSKSKLTRQHTIDSPGNFHARFLRKQVSTAAAQRAQGSGIEMTWVLADYTATNTTELSVHKGQQVEVVHNSSAPPDWALVRLSLGEECSEGLVPTCVLKQPPPSVLRTATSPSKRITLPIEQDLGK
ncbi:hypothetical protein M8J75_013033 [Diaphorina citri]|nr:hypothetical protein M8J75_013033 [Diaphorina citri]